MPLRAYLEDRPRADLSDAVHEAVRAWRVGIEYEPLVDVHTGETVGHEALTRFEAADGTALPPARVFAELRRDVSLLAEVELHLKRQQVERAPGRAVYLNLDPEAYACEAARPRNRFLDVLARRRLVDVVVEVTETFQGTTAGRARDTVKQLRGAGIVVALDDVGASGAVLSLDALRGADIVKFDRCILEWPGDPRERAIARGLVAVARALGARTVLEGVERPDQLEVAKGLGFDLVQGFLLRDRAVTLSPLAAAVRP